MICLPNDAQNANNQLVTLAQNANNQLVTLAVGHCMGYMITYSAACVQTVGYLLHCNSHASNAETCRP
jgi:hypothetical protein